MRLPIAAIFVCAGCGVSLAQTPDASRPAEASQADSATARVDEIVARFMKRRHIPGVSIAVVEGGKPTLVKSYGLANLELRVPATEETVYQIASITKTFTATMIMKLVKDGKLSLDDKITERLPDLPKAWGGVTIRHLLNHTSGIKDYTSTRDFDKSVRKDCSPRELLDLVATAPPDFAPGEKWLYDNTGYILLGMLIEKATGQPYGEAMDRAIFQPLGLTQTRANDLHAVIPNRSQGYRWDGKALRVAEYVSPTRPFAAGMLVSTIGDLVKWDAALTDQAILDEPTLALMWAPTRLNDGKQADYGFGWEASWVNGHRRASHGGAIRGFSTEIQRYLDDRLTVVVLTNVEGGRADALARGIAGLYVPALAEPPQPPIADADPWATKRLRGMFEGALKGEVDESLFDNQSRTRLVPAIRADRERLGSFGVLKTFELLERKEQDRGPRLVYRAVMENMSVKLTFDLDRDGKISGAGLQLED